MAQGHLLSNKSAPSIRFLSVDLYEGLLFLYFFTLHADQLNISLGGFSLRLNNLIGLFLLASFHIRFRKENFVMDKRLLYAILGITASIAVSFFFSPYKLRCFFFMGWFAITLGVYVWLPYQLLIRWKEKVLTLYFLSFLCVGCYAALQLVSSIAGLNDPFTSQFISGKLVRPNAFSYEPSFYALYMTPFVMLINFLYIRGEQSFTLFKALKLKHVIFVNGLFLASTATSAFFAYFVFFALLLLYSLRKNRPGLFASLLKFAFFLGVGFVLLLVCFPQFMRNFFLKFFVFGFTTHHSFLDRWTGIYNACRVFLDHPFFGVGLGGYPSYFFEAWLRGDSRFIYMFQDSLIGVVQNTMKLFEAHNAITELLASLGLVGVAAFAYLYWTLYQQRNKAIDRDVLGDGLFFSMIVMVIVLQFNQGILRTYVWTHFAITFAYLKCLANQTISEPLNIRNHLFTEAV